MPKIGRALLSVHDDKRRVIDLATQLLRLGFQLDTTQGTTAVLSEAGIEHRLVNKVHEGRPHLQDRTKNDGYTYRVNTTAGRQAITDSKLIRKTALQYKVPYDTTLNGAFATVQALPVDPVSEVISLQERLQRIQH